MNPTEEDQAKKALVNRMKNRNRAENREKTIRRMREIATAIQSTRGEEQ